MRTLICALALTGCATHTEPGETMPHDDATSGTSAPPTVDEPASDEVVASDGAVDLSAGINATGMALQPLLFGDASDNQVFSPASISLAFGMLASGARGETQSELYGALHLPSEGADEALGGLMKQLNATGDDQPLSLRIANRLWIDDLLAVEESYLDTTASLYGAQAESIAFHSLGDAAREPINTWVEEQTEQRIQDLLPAGSVNTDTRAVLVNAVYFKADWAKPFNADLTQDRDFTTAAGETVAVPTMSQQGLMRYAATDGVRVLSLPYKGDSADFVVVIPDDGDLAALERGMTTDSVQSWYDATAAHTVDLRLPRFELEASYDSLLPAMSELGAGRAFGPQADFSGIAAEGLEVSDAVHKAFILVDETGTEAAAATGIVVRATSMPVAPPVQVHVDRPFWFAVRDRASGTLLFTGHVVDPR